MRVAEAFARAALERQKAYEAEEARKRAARAAKRNKKNAVRPKKAGPKKAGPKPTKKHVAVVRPTRKKRPARVPSEKPPRRKRPPKKEGRPRDEHGRFLPKPPVPPPPPLPRREKKKPRVLRDDHGRFAPKDTVGEERDAFIQIYLPGWMHEDGTMAVAYSSLREHEKAQEYLEALRQAGDPESNEWKRIAELIATEANVHVQEVYTLGLSP
jgi:hypothetical protein